MTDDFFVRFDSNAKVWSKTLNDDLAGARKAIGGVNNLLKDLETNAANRTRKASEYLLAISKDADRVQKKIDRIQAGAGNLGVSEDSGRIESLVRSLQSYDAQFDHMFGQLARTVELIGRAGEEFKLAQQTQNRSGAQTGGDLTQTNRGTKFPAGTIVGQIDAATNQVIRAFDKAGRELAAGTRVGGRYAPRPEQLGLAPGSPIPGALSAAQMRELLSGRGGTISVAELERVISRVANTGGLGVQTGVHITDVPQATIDDAAFARVVTAIERNVSATERVEAAVNRLAERGGAGGGGGPVAEQVVEASSRLTREQNSELQRAFKEVLALAPSKEARDSVWKDLVAKQSAALAQGKNIITPALRAAMEERDARAGDPSRRSVEGLAKLQSRFDAADKSVGQLKSSLDELSGSPERAAEFGRALAELTAAEKERASALLALQNEETRAQTSERQRRAALREQQRISQLDPVSQREKDYGRETRAQLELGGDREALLARNYSKAQLQELADVFTRQGYTTGYKPVRDDTGLTRSTKSELVDAIVQSGQAYRAAGRATNEDLYAGRRVTATSEISPEVLSRIPAELQEFQQNFTREMGKYGISAQRAYELLSLNARSGGSDPLRKISESSVPGAGSRYNGRTKGRLEVGAAIGEELRGELSVVDRVLDEWARGQGQAAREAVGRMMSRESGFDPYSEDLFGGIQGKGDEAVGARRAAGQVLQATDEIDNFARDLAEMDSQLEVTDRQWREVTSRLIDFKLSLEQTSADRKQARRDEAELTQIEKRRAAQQTEIAKRLAGFEHYTGGAIDPQMIRSRSFLEDVRRRDESRLLAANPDAPLESGTGLMTRQEIAAEIDRRSREFREPILEQSQRRAALRSATFDYFGRGQVFATADGNTRDYTSRILPGIMATGTAGRQRLAFQDETRFRTPPPKLPIGVISPQGLAEYEKQAASLAQDRARASRALRAMTSGIQGYISGLNKLIDAVAQGDHSEEELNQLRERTARALSRMLAGYQSAFPEQPARPIAPYLPEHLGFDNDYLSRAFDSIAADEKSLGYNRVQDSAAMREIRRMNKGDANVEAQQALLDKAEAAYNDPGRGALLDKQNQAALKSGIKALNRKIRDAEAEVGAYEQALRSAERELKKELRPNSRGRVADLKAHLDELADQEARLHLRSGGFVNTGPGQSGSVFDSAALDANREAQRKARATILAEETATPRLRELYEQRAAAQAALSTAPDIDALRQNRDDLQFRRRVLTGNYTEKDVSKAQAAVDAMAARRVQVERRLIEASERLAAAEKKLADIDSRTADRRSGSAAGDGTEQEVYQLLRETVREMEVDLARIKDAQIGADHAGNDDEYERLSSQRIDLERQIAEVKNQMVGLNVPSPDLEDGGLLSATHKLGERPKSIDAAIAASDAAVEERQKLADSIEVEKVAVRDATNALASFDAELNEVRGALARMAATQKERDSRRGSKAENPDNVGGGSGSGDGTGVGTGEPGEGDSNILLRILRAVLDVNKTLNSGIRVTGEVTGTGVPGAGTASNRQYLPRSAKSTQAGREAFQTAIGNEIPEVQQLLAAGKDVEAAAQLVARGVLSETRALDLFRDKLNLDTEAAKRFHEQMRAAAGDARLQAAAAEAGKERAKLAARQYTLRDGSSITQKEARAEMEAALGQQKRQQEAATKTGRAQRIAAAETARLAEVMGRLSPETRHEIAELERMVRALNAMDAGSEQAAKAQADLARQMAHVYGGVARDVGPARDGGGAQVARSTVGQVYQGAGVKATQEEIDEMARYAKTLGHKVDAAAAAGTTPGGLFGEHSLFTQAMFGNHGFWSRIMASTGTFVVRNFAAGFVFGMTAALHDVIAQAIETERTFVRVSHALEATGRSSQGLRASLGSIAQEYGTQLNDVYQVAAGLTGLFDNVDDIAAATKIVSQLEMISSGALNATEAMGALASIQGAFADQLGTGVAGLEKVADVLTSVQNNVGTNVEVTAEAVGRMSGLAAQLGLSYEETAVYGAQIAKLTNQTGAAAGEQFSRILSVIQSGRGREVLAQLEKFTATGRGDQKKGAVVETDIVSQLQSRNYSGALRTLQSSWDDLSDAQRQNISVTIAGQRQAAAFAALMNNGTRTLNAIARAENSHGDAVDRTQALMRTLQGRIAKLTSELQVFASNLLQSGVLDFLGIFLATLNMVLHGTNELLTLLNGFAQSNPIVHFATQAGAALLGFMLILNLMRRSWNGLKATLNNTEFIQAARQAPGQTRTDSLLSGIRQNAAARSTAVFQRLTGGDLSTGSRDINNPFTRLAGRGLDTVLGRPLEAAGRAATRFSETLIARSQEMMQQTATRSDGRLIMGDVNRAVIMNRAGLAVGRGAEVLGGFAAGTREFFQGQGLNRLQANFENRAQRYSFAAEGARVAAATDPSNRALQRNFTVLNAMSKVSDGASASMTRLNSGLTRMARSGVGADLAMAAVTTAISGMILSAQRSAEAGQAVADILDARRNKGTGDGTDVDPYAGPAQEAYKEFTKTYTKDQGSAFQSGLEFVGATLGNIPDYFTSFGQSDSAYEKMTGTKDGKIAGLDEAQKAYDQGMKELSDIAAQPGVTSEELLKYADATTKKFYAADAKVRDNKDLSEQQKLASLAASEQARQLLEAQIQSLVAESEGLKSAGLLESEQLDRLGEIVTNLGAIQSSQYALSELRTGVDAMIGEAGIDSNNPEIKRALDALQQGGLDSVDTAKQQSVIIRQMAKQAEIKYVTALKSGEQEQIEPARQKFETLMTQVAGLAEQNIQTFVNNATLISQEAAAHGDFAGARAALLKGVQDIEGEKPAGVTTALNAPSRRFGAQDYTATQFQTTYTPAEQELIDKQVAQQRALMQQYVQSDAAERNRVLQIQAAATQDEVSSARNAVSQARNVLAAMRDARRINEEFGPTATEIHDQRVAVLQAQAQQAQAMAARRAARRDTTLAAIAPGNAVAQANQQVANAQAALHEAEQYGQRSVQYQTALQQLYGAQNQAMSAQQAVTQAQLALSQAYAQAAGNAVGSAQIGVEMANNALAAALQASGGAESADVLGARAQVVNAQAQVRQASLALAQSQIGILSAQAQAQGDSVRVAQLQARAARTAMSYATAGTAEWNQAKAQLIAANDAIQNAQLDLINARIGISIALAEAAGNTVRAAQLRVKQAQAAVRAATPGTAEFAQARAGVISAQAAVRDAELQDRLDTINFNLEMGRTTQSAAIAALRQILRTRDLTKEQRRQLLLQIKQMTDELSDSPWNFGDIKLPKPYLMKRYIEEQRRANTARADSAIQDSLSASDAAARTTGTGAGSYNDYRQVKVDIHGADIAELRKILRELIGTPTRTRTSAPRRGRR